MARPFVPHNDRDLPYARDPIVFWAAFIAVFAVLVAVLGLVLGQTIAARRAAMLSFVTESYQLASDAGTAAQRPVRIVLAR